MTLILDGWGGKNRDHIVDFIAVLKGAAFFMDSKCVDDTKKTTQAQADLVSAVLEPFGGSDAFAAVGSGNTQSCFNMREIIFNKYPGVVSMNDRSHIANLDLSGMLKTPFSKRVLANLSALRRCSSTFLS